ncbi:recombination-associated protein RdgC [Rhodoferax antarcticus]|uniref:Recombination-associated protein RdgC n=1 Tax=Rhodoferax antarcticus ANT.BR TaxID=1111071 RepID=A0A1Q8Y9L0_9BURK|nr:recombination-associated protein RdgC [Rhodoferax antarcticus]OLP04659.1 putative exonuclease, rdgC [Rhodoferax antarcticus ANT.BR]
MFKNASVFRIALPNHFDAASLANEAEKAAFLPCGPTQERSIGWVPPRDQAHGALVESVGGHWMMKLMIESRSVPGKALNEAVDERCAKILEQTGRSPGKKEKRDIKEDAKLALLPQAFPKKTAVLVWIDRMAGFLVLDSATASKADEVVTRLVQLGEGIVVTAISTTQSPGTVMTGWLADGDQVESGERFGFDVATSCELMAKDESKARVRYSNHNLMCSDVIGHILSGKTATKLGLTYEDRVAFCLSEAGTLSGLKFLDVVFADSAKTHEDEFDANVTILTGEMSKLIPNLIDSLGGEMAVVE